MLQILCDSEAKYKNIVTEKEANKHTTRDMNQERGITLDQ